ncbi:unnamed protein product [Blepharisma stoltei]|uniref:Uncharacterized protein n=1 Tax=Blepharisma stoltei TaxID=1481888 RepID=A0AAU9JQP8_9CILI|nr:unnamed protein product [Blepharisma stoltei]
MFTFNNKIAAESSYACECSGECLGKLINSTSEMLLLKFQEVLQTERLMMMEMINNDSNKDALLLQLVNKAEELNRENAVLTLENRGYKEILNNLKRN